MVLDNNGKMVRLFNNMQLYFKLKDLIGNCCCKTFFIEKVQRWVTSDVIFDVLIYLSHFKNIDKIHFDKKNIDKKMESLISKRQKKSQITQVQLENQ